MADDDDIHTILSQDANECLRVLYNLTDRVMFGNPRLLKGEREAIAKMGHDLTEQISGFLVMMGVDATIVGQLKEQKQLLVKILGVIVIFLEHNDTESALDLARKVHDRMKHEED